MSEFATFGSGGAEPYARALLQEEETLYLHSVDGARSRIDVTRWTDDADAVDRALLRRARGPVL
ncbi:MAG: SAM-dependent methyltransferase, partial [Pseudolysinimonas sp.]